MKQVEGSVISSNLRAKHNSTVLTHVPNVSSKTPCPSEENPTLVLPNVRLYGRGNPGTELVSLVRVRSLRSKIKLSKSKVDSSGSRHAKEKS